LIRRFLNCGGSGKSNAIRKKEWQPNLKEYTFNQMEDVYLVRYEALKEVEPKDSIIRGFTYIK